MGGFGLQFGTVLGFMTEKKAFKSGPKRMSKKKIIKAPFGIIMPEGRRNGGGR